MKTTNESYQNSNYCTNIQNNVILTNIQNLNEVTSTLTQTQILDNQIYKISNEIYGYQKIINDCKLIIEDNIDMKKSAVVELKEILSDLEKINLDKANELKITYLYLL